MALFRKIVVPVDGSEPSDGAVSLAIRVARDQHASLVFVHACETAKIAAMVSAPAVGIDPSLAIDAERRAGDEALDAARHAAETAGIECACVLEDGASVETILEIVRRHRADLIVIGSHGRGGIPRALLGSVTEATLRRSTVPILVAAVHPQ